MGRGVPYTLMAKKGCVCKKVGSFVCSLLTFLLVASFMSAEQGGMYALN